MPKLYQFPESPQDTDVRFDDSKLLPFRLGLSGEEPIIITPPTKQTNYIGFIFHCGKELFRFAMVADVDEDRLVMITEDGKEMSMQELHNLAFKIALGSERYEKARHIIEKE